MSIQQPALVWGIALWASLGSLGLLGPEAINAQSLPSDQSTFTLAQFVSGCPRAEVIEAYETPNFFAYICGAADGSVFYRGVDKSSGQQINVFGVSSGGDGTYYATNGDVTYTINPSQLQVFQNNRLILSEPVINR
ncbi:MAG: hypothetical protein HC835_06055 [Oscillatoriales cyanobacterium RM2_1_1]|nr:hypothetical protein [Oscillatoriales cyanobacterium SM2_3_0]NJO45220.1 hypothetical protein [Oscillatoriales cyanobacterium RM2_1_1]